MRRGLRLGTRQRRENAPRLTHANAFCCSLARLPGILSPSLDSASHLASSMAVGRCGSRVGSCGTATHAQSVGFAHASQEGWEKGSPSVFAPCSHPGSTISSSAAQPRRSGISSAASWPPPEAGQLARLSSSLNCPPSRSVAAASMPDTDTEAAYIKMTRCPFFEILFRV